MGTVLPSHTENLKHAAGAEKNSIKFIPPEVILQLGAVMKHGADKYQPYDWRKNGADLGTYYDAAQRHLLAIWSGEWLDEGMGGSGLPHAAHVMACMAIILDAKNGGNLSGKISDYPG